MVVRLEGKIDGNDIIFQKEEGDRWKATVPRNLIGSYAVELVAVDEAGNCGFATKYLLTVDTNSLHIKLVPLPYFTELIDTPYRVEAAISNYYSQITDTGISSTVRLSNYYAEIVKDKCGR